MSSVHRSTIQVDGRSFRAVLAQGSRNRSTHIPVLPGLVATGATLDDVKRRLIEAAAFHLEGLQRPAAPDTSPRFAPSHVTAGSPEPTG